MIAHNTPIFNQISQLKMRSYSTNSLNMVYQSQKILIINILLITKMYIPSRASFLA